MTTKSKPSDPRAGWLALARELESHLLHLREEGATEVEADPVQVRRLAEPPVFPPPAAEGAPETADSLAAIAREVDACARCPLHSTRTRTVPGQGSTAPEIMFIGEGPGADEDQQGLAFVGRAGQLLTKIIEAMGFTRDQVFIGNIVKCRPPGNRVPMPEEMQTCLPFLRRQIALLKPKVIVALGATAVKGLLDVQSGITRLRGQWMSYEGIDLMPTFHPAYLLRNPSGKKDVWEDMKAVLARLGREPPPRK
ncbi:MAG TPA: uracil-DNA glycosylase [Kiritimatiellia bacterium]|nr:uracil-DNA glycosylase [Kiritimatiellia bacterium]HRZ12650.1 uracil-DNA glycosylase [Kiritimatiellia bacterium]HSA19582.1 uracil-DNA glycosylase [Kiritimatiellia bacterium]